MKNLKFALISIMVAAGMFACGGAKVEKTASASYPMFWTWMSYNPRMNFDSLCTIMNEAGIDGVMLNASTPDDYRQAIPIAQKHGIEVYAWVWTMNLNHNRDSIVKAHPEWFQVNRNGESLADHEAYVNYYKFMCPALPEVREYIKDRIRGFCEVEGLNGIAIDYHRFVDVILPTTLWPKYGIEQDQEYAQWDYGYHPAMIEKFKALYGYDPRDQEDPAFDEKWLQFRCDQITEVANEIADVVHSYGKKMAASPFPTPAMSRQMVRQDWGKWNLDIVFPMAYANFYTGDPGFISDCTIENVKTKNETTTLYCGLMTSGPGLFEGMDAALNNGAQGIAIYTVMGLRPEVRAQFKHYADSVRAQRASSAVNPAATGRTTVNTDPFSMPGIMKAVDMRIAAYASLAKTMADPVFKNVDKTALHGLISNAMQTNTSQDYLGNLKSSVMPRRGGAPANPAMEAVVNHIADTYSDDIKLGDFKLVNERGATKYYNVTDLKSGMAFNVNFYFYGGILSGFNVEPQTKIL